MTRRHGEINSGRRESMKKSNPSSERTVRDVRGEYMCKLAYGDKRNSGKSLFASKGLRIKSLLGDEVVARTHWTARRKLSIRSPGEREMVQEKSLVAINCFD